MTTAAPKLETLPTEQVYGIAKRISLDLEKYPLHTHASIINIVNTMCQHRKIVMEEPERQRMAEYEEVQRRAQMQAFEAAQAAQVERDARIAEQIKAADEPKVPRSVIVLGEPRAGEPSAADLDAVEREKEAALQTALQPTEELTTQ